MKLRYFFSFILLSSVFLIGVHRGSAAGDGQVEVLTAGLRRYIANELSAHPSSIKISGIRAVNGHQEIQTGKVISIKPATSGQLLGRTIFIMRTKQAGKAPVKQWISANVYRVKKVLVAMRSLRRHQVVRKEDLQIKPVRIKDQRKQFETNAGKLVGKRMTRSIPKGAPVHADLVEEAPVIQRGERVTLVLEMRGLKITTIGKTKEDGHLGELIKVINLDSGKVVFGEVKGPGQVEIDLGKK